MKYFLIAGEASGDLHASNLMSGLKIKDPEAKFSFIGGDLMSEVAGKRPIQHYKEMNFMGLFAVLRHLGRLRKIMKESRSALLSFDPDVLILIDYAGFNLRLARFASKRGIRVFYYISPKVWAWRKSRLKSLKRYVDQLFVIFPFELEFFRKNDLHVEFHGNPLMDQLEEFKKRKQKREVFLSENNLEAKPIIALLAGSRRQEITACLPEMIQASHHFPNYQFVVAGAPSVDRSIYENILENSRIRIIYNNTYNLLNNSIAAIVTSGTATLETALFNVPQIVVYKTAPFTYRLGKLFVKIKFFSLVNLIVGYELVKEILQFNLSNRIGEELQRILNDEKYRTQMLSGYSILMGLIGKAGASERVANKMIKLLS
jgi:lipid-A-disaccharide synthase